MCSCGGFYTDNVLLYHFNSGISSIKMELQDDCMNAHPYAELLVVVFSSIKNDFKEHSGAQTDSKPLFLH